MLFRFVNANKLALPLIYFFFLACLVAALGYLFYAQVTCQNCSASSINPSSFLMPIIAYLSIGLVGITIGFTRKTASEKNALEFEKEMSELGEHFQVLYTVRQGMLLPDGNLNRRKAVAYMHELYAPASSSTAAPGATKAGPSFENRDDSATQFFFTQVLPQTVRAPNELNMSSTWAALPQLARQNRPVTLKNRPLPKMQ